MTLGKLWLLFLSAALAAGAVWAALAVWVLHTTDPKFDAAPVLAFAIELVGGIALALAGTVILCIATSVRGRRKTFDQSTRSLAIAAGVAYGIFGQLLALALQPFAPSAPRIRALMLSYVVLFPAAAAVLLVRRARVSPLVAEAHANNSLQRTP